MLVSAPPAFALLVVGSLGFAAAAEDPASGISTSAMAQMGK